MPEADLHDIDFTLLGAEDLVRLGEDFVRALPLATRDPIRSRVEERWVDSISAVISRAGKSPTGLSPPDAAVLADTFRQALQRIDLSDSHTRGLWVRLYVHALLRGLQVFPDVKLSAESPEFVPLGFADVWKGKYHGNPVCIKAIRTRNIPNLEKIKMTFYDEVDGCRHFSHPNILPIVQVSEGPFPFCIMSPWLPGGNVIQHTQKHQGANRLMLLSEVCNGLSYLHGLEILHGSIAPGNILITRDGRACLSDFGIVHAFGDSSFTGFKLGTARYMALERLDFFSGSPSKKSDIYSLAMTSFTVLTGLVPYEDVSGHYTLLVRVKSGDRPSRPTNLDATRWLQDNIWNMIITCWGEDPNQRWEIAAICELFSKLSLQEVQKVKSDIKTGERQRTNNRGFRPRLSSLFQFLLVPESEIQRQISEMDERLESSTLTDRERFKLFNDLCKTCSKHRVIPKSMHIPDFSKDTAEAEYFGGFSSVSQGTYEGHQVAIKVVNVYVTNVTTILSGFCREVVAWKHLRHPNILPLLGVSLSENRFVMISEWMDNGNINEFVRKDYDANRIALLADVANGLKYMHDLRIVHGDLKGANILVDKEKRACIADFSLTTVTGVGNNSFAGVSIMSAMSDDTLTSFTAGGTFRWMSPELLDPDRFEIPRAEGDRPTRQSDCYAMGMVIYEVLCGHYPYEEIQNNILLVNAIVEGDRPMKPEGAARLGFNNELWTLIELCWREARAQRPRVEEIITCLNGAAAYWYMKEL